MFVQAESQFFKESFDVTPCQTKAEKRNDTDLRLNDKCHEKLE